MKNIHSDDFHRLLKCLKCGLCEIKNGKVKKIAGERSDAGRDDSRTGYTGLTRVELAVVGCSFYQQSSDNIVNSVLRFSPVTFTQCCSMVT